jgi:hypothetical protein
VARSCSHSLRRVEAWGRLTGAAGYELGCSEEAEQGETRQRFMEDWPARTVCAEIPILAHHEGTMAEYKFEHIWQEQCAAARKIRVQFGVLSCLDYLIGEKLMTFADTAVTRPEFARELPRFVAEIRAIFSGEEIRHYLDHLERTAAIEDECAPNENDEGDSPEQLAARRARFAQLKKLLTATVLGTG